MNELTTEHVQLLLLGQITRSALVALVQLWADALERRWIERSRLWSPAQRKHVRRMRRRRR